MECLKTFRESNERNRERQNNETTEGNKDQESTMRTTEMSNRERKR
jgi:hypothetical protein